MKASQTFAILIWLNSSRGKNRMGTLFARVTVNGKRSEISLKREIENDKWDTSAGKVKGNSPAANSLNQHINEVKTQLFVIYQELHAKKEFISTEVIKKKFLGEEKIEYTLLSFIQLHNEDLKKRIGVDVAKATWVKYNTVLKKIQAFLLEYVKKPDVYLNQLNHSFISDFEYYLRALDKTGSNTAMKYIRMLKKIMNEAVRKDWLEKNPFQAFKCTFRWKERDVCSIEEINRIMSHNFEPIRLQLVKDYFVFSCFTGLAYVDLIGLQPASITLGLDGNKWLVFNRSKTGIAVKVPLLPKALEIIDKYHAHPESLRKNKVFPVLSNQKLNSYLKEIGDICGIRKELTFHLARHTFATTIALSNGVPIESVSKMLGHTKIATTQIYARVLEAKLNEDVNKLRARLESIIQSQSSKTKEH